MKYREKYLLDIDYKSELEFDKNWIVSDKRARVGYAIVDETRI